MYACICFAHGQFLHHVQNTIRNSTTFVWWVYCHQGDIPSTKPTYTKCKRSAHQQTTQKETEITVVFLWKVKREWEIIVVNCTIHSLAWKMLKDLHWQITGNWATDTINTRAMDNIIDYYEDRQPHINIGHSWPQFYDTSSIAFSAVLLPSISYLFL